LKYSTFVFLLATMKDGGKGHGNAAGLTETVTVAVLLFLWWGSSVWSNVLLKKVRCSLWPIACS
jgi:hypothetical protein